MQPTDILRNEHRVIERVLAVLDKIATRAEESRHLPVETIQQVIDFLRQFADRCHHAKEENLLFPALEAKGFPREGGPTGVMLYEHEQGRGLIGQMSQALLDYSSRREDAVRRFCNNAQQYVALLRQHISKEDNILFVLAERTLAPEELAQMSQDFEKAERERVGEGVHERYEKLAKELLNGLGIDETSVPRSGDFFCCH